MTRATAKRSRSGRPAASPIDERPSFLLHRVTAELARVSNPVFRRYGIDVITARILVIVLERDGPYVGEVVELMSLPQSTVSHQIKRLEAAALVERRQDRDDNRAFRVYLTPKGRRIAEICNERSVQINAALLDGLNAAERRQLLERLRTIRTRLAGMSPEDW